MNPVLDAIYENLRELRLVSEPTLESFKGDRKQTADSKELTVKQFPRQVK